MARGERATPWPGPSPRARTDRIDARPAREVRYALPQGPKAGDETTHPRSSRATLQTRRHRRRRRGRRDVRRRPDQRRLLQPLHVQGGSRRQRPRRPAARPTPQPRHPAVESAGARSVHPRLPLPAAPRPVRRRLPVGCATRRDRTPPRRHQTRIHRRTDRRRRRHRLAPWPRRPAGDPHRRAHDLRTDDRPPATRPSTDRPRPPRSAPPPRREDRPKTAERPSLTALQNPTRRTSCPLRYPCSARARPDPRQADWRCRRRLEPRAREHEVGVAGAHVHDETASADRRITYAALIAWAVSTPASRVPV